MNTWQCCGELVLLRHTLISFFLTFLSKYMCSPQCLCRIYADLFIFLDRTRKFSALKRLPSPSSASISPSFVPFTFTCPLYLYDSLN